MSFSVKAHGILGASRIRNGIEFSDLKAAVTSAPVLQPFRVDSDHMIEADASSVGLGAVLLQADVNSNIFRPVAFHSRKLSSAEKNYPTREQEFAKSDN